jgi:hypothetical protein
VPLSNLQLSGHASVAAAGIAPANPGSEPAQLLPTTHKESDLDSYRIVDKSLLFRSEPCEANVAASETELPMVRFSCCFCRRSVTHMLYTMVNISANPKP